MFLGMDIYSWIAAIVIALIVTFLPITLPFKIVLAMVALAVLVAYTEYGSRMWSLLIETSLGRELPASEDGGVLALAEQFGLTKREKEVIALLLQGRSMGYIAEKTFVSENTIKSHVQHVYRKCGVHSKQELIDMVKGHEE